MKKSGDKPKKDVSETRVDSLLMPVTVPTHYVAAVSYTHLDVYKRQIWA